MIVEPARAKVNLALHVVGRRADGYHLLDTLAVFPDIGDTVTLRPADGLSLAIEGEGAAALGDEPIDDNLVLRAARGLAEAFPARPGAAIVLTKTLPVASGLGGGSADAAATLRALCRLDGLDPRSPAVMAIAARLGADVPMCVVSQTLRARGVGERIERVASLPGFGIVLVNPRVPVSTPAVFRALVRRDNAPLPEPAFGGDLAALVGWLGATRNDLEAPAVAIAPAVGAVLERLRAGPGCLFARMSGSGATCFAVTADAAGAAALARAVAAAEPGWWVRAGVV